MAMRYRNFIPGALVVLGIVFGAALAGPASYAQETMVLQPAEDRDVPEGSQIPDWRIDETEEKVEAYKAKMRERAAREQEALPQDEDAKPNGNQ